MRLIQRIELHLKQSGMSATRFGLALARDPNLVSDLRKGRVPRRRLRERINAWLEGGAV